ncbi:unnamed protein product [Choristocarpus tenellus]
MSEISLPPCSHELESGSRDPVAPWDTVDEPITADEKGGMTSQETLTVLSDLEKLGLAIRFGKTRLCAALTHGHSFETSIFRLPAKCSACSEVVWGPFNRGCTCLTCGLISHRSCAGKATMPPCPTKDQFLDFCRMELRMSNKTLAATEKDGEEWSTVESGGGHEESRSKRTSCEDQVQSLSQSQSGDPLKPSSQKGGLGSSFCWVPFSVDRRASFKSSSHPTATNATADAIVPASSVTEPYSATVSGIQPLSPVVSHETDSSKCANGQSNTSNKSGLRSFSSLSVAGGFMGAMIGGPCGAMFGLKLGVVFAAGKMSAESLWQRIEKERREASAQEIGVVAASNGGRGEAAASVGPRSCDIWAQIAMEIEAGSTWNLDEEERQRLELGECDVQEVAGFVVGKMLEDENSGPHRLHLTLLATFRSRHPRADTSPGSSDQMEVAEDIVYVGSSVDTEMVTVYKPLWAGGGESECDVGDGGCGDSDYEGSFSDGCSVGRNHADEGVGGVGQFAALEKGFSFVSESECMSGEGAGYRGKESPSMAEEGSKESALGQAETAVLDLEGWALGDSNQPMGHGNGGGEMNARDDPQGSRRERWVKLDEVSCTGGETAVGGIDTDPVGATDLGMGSCSSVWLLPGEYLEGGDRILGEAEGWGRVYEGAAEGGRGAIPELELGESLCRHVGAKVDASVDTTDATAAASESSCGTGAGEVAGKGNVAGCCAQEPQELEAGRRVGAEEGSTAVVWVEKVLSKRSKGVGQEGVGVTTKLSKMSITTSTAAADCDCPTRDGLSSSLVTLTLHQGDGEMESNHRCGGERDSPHCGNIGGTVGPGSSSGSHHSATAPLSPIPPPQPPPLSLPLTPPDPLRDVHGYLRELTRAVLAACPSFLTSSEEATLQAVNAVDRRVFAECYDAVFNHVAAQQRAQDKSLSTRLRREATTRRATGLQPFSELCCPQALVSLRAMGRAQTSFDKLGCLVRAVEDMIQELPGGPEAVTADDLLWSLCVHLAAGPVALPHAEVAFIEQFVRDEYWLLGREGYVLTSVEAAMHILHDPAISREVFEDPGPGREVSWNGRSSEVGIIRDIGRAAESTSAAAAQDKQEDVEGEGGLEGSGVVIGTVGDRSRSSSASLCVSLDVVDSDDDAVVVVGEEEGC